MDTLNYSVPDGLADFVVARVNEAGYGSVDEYVGELIRADQLRKAKALLEAEVLQGIRSPKAPLTDKDWADVRAAVVRRYQARRASSRPMQYSE